MVRAEALRYERIIMPHGQDVDPVCCALVRRERLRRSSRDPAVTPGAGVPLSLAEERARRMTDLRYELHFAIPAEADRADYGDRSRSASR